MLETGLSIVIPHYNRPWCLEVAVASLRRALSRNGMPFEVIVADDGSDPEIGGLLERCGADRVLTLTRHTSPRDESDTLYDTIWAAYKSARYRYILHAEDDFWFIPQGFRDLAKNHCEGLLAVPDYRAEGDPVLGAIELLESNNGARVVELARSFGNPRYPSVPNTERSHGGVRFRAKVNDQGKWYLCAWPHIVRTTDALSVPLPTGSKLWAGELRMVSEKARFYGTGDWVYDPELCFFAHVSIFTWRSVHKRKPGAEVTAWAEIGEHELPFLFPVVPDLNIRLLEAFKHGRLHNNLDDYFDSGPLSYVYRNLFRSVCS